MFFQVSAVFYPGATKIDHGDIIRKYECETTMLLSSADSKQSNNGHCLFSILMPKHATLFIWLSRSCTVLAIMIKQTAYPPLCLCPQVIFRSRIMFFFLLYLSASSCTVVQDTRAPTGLASTSTVLRGTRNA